MNKTQQDYNIIASHFSQTRTFNWPEFSSFVEMVKNKSKVLDLGCGNGRLYQLLQEKKVDYLGVDSSENLIKIARDKYGKDKFNWGDIRKNECWRKLGKYDAVFCLAVLHHFIKTENQAFLVKKINEHLNKDGLLFITVWNLWQLRFWLNHLRGKSLKLVTIPYKLSDGKRVTKIINRVLYSFSKGGLRKLVKKNGLNVKRIYYSKKDKKSNWIKGYNLCLIGKKEV